MVKTNICSIEEGDNVKECVVNTLPKSIDTYTKEVLELECDNILVDEISTVIRLAVLSAERQEEPCDSSLLTYNLPRGNLVRWKQLWMYLRRAWCSR